MADSLPLPAEAPNRPDPGALDPTEVIPRPQPVEAGEAAEVRVISGEVVGGRHRGQRRGPGRGSLGTAVLTATGAVAGLSMLMPHGGGSSVAEAAQEPVKAVPDGVVEDIVVPRTAGAAVAAETAKADPEAVTKVAYTGPDAAASTGTGSGTHDTARTHAPDGTPGPGRHARASGTWDSEDWQEAVARAVAAHRSGEHGQLGGRHRAGGGHGWDRGPGGGPWGGGRPGPRRG
ncbi:hypothetical protein PV703_19365 [Streptomyces sp. ME01-24h]|nr:hypothetical protein [Streptomyces sp. ME19-03-3]MDX3355427.1 hypothetical protein [Streptomyces sp. ME01-24h]